MKYRNEVKESLYERLSSKMTREKFNEVWREKMSDARSLFFLKKESLSQVIYNDMTSNSFYNKLSEYGKTEDRKAFRQSFQSVYFSDAMKQERLDRTSNYFSINADDVITVGDFALSSKKAILNYMNENGIEDTKTVMLSDVKDMYIKNIISYEEFKKAILSNKEINPNKEGSL